MNETEFRATLKAGGYEEPEIIERAAAPFNDDHTHEFTACALVLEGEVTVKTATGETTCRAGDHFELTGGIAHCEQYGPNGARFLLGRKALT